MIFNKFRKPRWQHQDAKIRCEAILELSREVQKDKDILRELAFNDGDHTVRLSALKQLDDFNLCWMALKQDKDKRVQQWSHQRIEQWLCASDESVPSEAIHSFIKECRDSRFLESIWRNLPALEHRLAILTKLNKTPLYIEAIVTETDSNTREALAAKLTTKDDLSRLLKKLKPTDPLHSRTHDALTQIAQQEQRPDEIRHELVQVKAIFNAVKEKHDYHSAQERLQRTVARWQALEPELSWLPEHEQKDAIEHTQALQDTAQAYVETLKQQWQLAHAEELLKQEVATQQQALMQQWQALRNQLKEAIASQQWSAQESLINAITTLSTEVDSSVLSAKEKEAWQSKLLGLRQHIDKLSLIPDTLKTLAELLDQLEQTSLPDSEEDVNAWEEAKSYYNQWKQQWKAALSGLDEFVPTELDTRFTTLSKQWANYLTQTSKAIQQHVKQTQYKLGELNRLLDNGRSRDAIGLLKKIEAWHQQLPSSDAQRLARRIEQAKQRVDEIRDWKAYAGAPKKQQLIQDIALLVDSPLADPVIQAQQIKEARATWQTLGQLDTEEDRIFNKAFNELCEKAFQPCRVYYQEQEALRAEALVEREQLCTQMDALAEKLTAQPSPDWRALESEFHRLNNQWRQCGNIEREQKKGIFNRYRHSANQVRTLLTNWHDSNLTQKQTLLNEAKQIAEDQSLPLNERAEHIKAIQQRWKAIGYAGKDDRTIWQSFRQCCDILFGQLKEENAGRRQQHDSVKSALMARLDELTEQASDSAHTQNVLDAIARFEEDTDAATALNGNERRQLAKRANELQKQLMAQMRKAHLSHEEATITAVLLNKPEEAENHHWVNLCQHYSSAPSSTETRHALVVEAEILTDTETPDEDAALRQQIQLSLLTKGESIGNQLAIQPFLKRWVSIGALTDTDKALAERFKNALVNGLQ